jgi:hypothetical protein
MTTARNSRHVESAGEQLSLFSSQVPERFRLDDATRRRGMRHVAALRARLEARYPSTPRSRPADEQRRVQLGARSHRHAA